jgi:DNA-binding transcriptional regulator PaaX
MDMLRGAPASGRRVAYLIETGSLFGFPENTVRVTLSRLQARGLIESPERGRYKLAPTADPVNEFVERWRLGE